MKFLSFAVIAFALAFCGLGEKIKQISKGAGSGANASSNSPSNTAKDNTETPGETPTLSSTQQSIADSASAVKWEDQGITWRLPSGWKKMEVKKETFNYSSPDNAFLLVNISPMSSDFPMDSSREAFYKQALDQLKNGKYESVRYLDIDGIRGVEWKEAMPEEKDGARRHQWIGYRNYLGQNQMLNVMLSIKGTNFDKHKDDFPAILYSTKFTK